MISILKSLTFSYFDDSCSVMGQKQQNSPIRGEKIDNTRHSALLFGVLRG